MGFIIWLTFSLTCQTVISECSLFRNWPKVENYLATSFGIDCTVLLWPQEETQTLFGEFIMHNNILNSSVGILHEHGIAYDHFLNASNNCRALIDSLDALSSKEFLNYFLKYSNKLHWFVPWDQSALGILPLRLDSQLYSYQDDGGQIIINEHYKVKNGTLKTNLVFEINYNMQPIVKPNVQYIWDRRKDLNGTFLTCVTTDSPPTGMYE